MKEFSFKIDKHLSVGLRRNYRENFNTPSAEDIVNLETSTYGLSPFEYPKMCWTEEQLNMMGITLSFPFPQLLKLTGVTLLVGGDYIFIVNEYDLSLTRIDTYDYYNPDNQIDIAPGGIWKSMDFYNTWVLTNGECSLWWDDSLQKLLVEKSVKFSAITEYKGRGIFGGFNAEDDWNSNWMGYWNSLGETPRYIGGNWIYWSSIGDGLRDILNANISQDRILRNDAGTYPLRAREKVVSIAKFQGRLVIFSLDTVSIFSHKSSPTSTISPDTQNISSGILNRGAMAVGREGIIYVDLHHRLWWIQKNFQPILLGYQEYLRNSIGRTVIVSYNDLNDTFYISDGDLTYILTWDVNENRPHGLSTTPQIISSYASITGKMCNTGTDLTDKKWLYRTSVFNLDRIGLKSIRWLTFFGKEGILNTTSGTIMFRIYWRQNIAETFKVSKWKKVNKDGTAYFPVSGNEFKIEIVGEDMSLIDISYIQVSYQNEDYRYTRGIDVTKANS